MRGLFFVFLCCIASFPVRSEAGDKGRFFPGGCFTGSMGNQHQLYRDCLPPYSGTYGRYCFRPYYFHYPHEEKSPYHDLVIRPAGELHITVRPSEAKVFVDGYELAKENDLFFSIGLLTGDHSVEVLAEGYKPYCQEVQIERGKKKVLSVALTK